jgi:hypothetical protein
MQLINVLNFIILLTFTFFFVIFAEILEKSLYFHIAGVLRKKKYFKEFLRVSKLRIKSIYSIRSLNEILIVFRLLLSFLPFVFLPIFGMKPILSSGISLVYIFLLLQIQLTFDVFISWRIQSNLFKVEVYRLMVWCVLSSFLSIIALFSIVISSRLTDLRFINYKFPSYLELFPCITVLLFLLCKNSMIFFGFIQINDVQPIFRNSESMPKVFEIKKMYKTLDIIFSCSFFILLFLNYNFMNNIYQIFLFILQLFILLCILFYFQFTRPFLTVNQWLRLFKNIILPVCCFVSLFWGVIEICFME